MQFCVSYFPELFTVSLHAAMHAKAHFHACLRQPPDGKGVLQGSLFTPSAPECASCAGWECNKRVCVPGSKCVALKYVAAHMIDDRMTVQSEAS
jgi:hypothetical protein